MNQIDIKIKKIIVLIFAVLAVFLISKYIVSGNNPDIGLGFAVQPLSKGFSLAGSGVQYEFYKDKLKSYPEPDKFRHFEYSEPSRQNGGSYGAGKNSDIEFNGECSDLYYTILIYSKDIDYRKNPASAKLNQAFECPKTKKFKFRIAQDTGLAKGKYYIIIADQGKEGTWFNPR